MDNYIHISDGNDPFTFDKPIYESNIMETNKKITSSKEWDVPSGEELEKEKMKNEVLSIIQECSSFEELCIIQDTIEERVNLLFHTRVWRDTHFREHPLLK